MSQYKVEVERRRANKMMLTTSFFDNYDEAEEYYKHSKKRDGKNRYTYSVSLSNFRFERTR